MQDVHVCNVRIRGPSPARPAFSSAKGAECSYSLLRARTDAPRPARTRADRGLRPAGMKVGHTSCRKMKKTARLVSWAAAALQR